MRRFILPFALMGLFATLLALEPTPTAIAGDDEVAVPPGVEVEARGAVHEAYAEPSGAAAVPGPEVAKQPPSRIDEIPPEEKPAGDNVAWLPGYWSWDEEAANFVWISGFWRVMPAGRTWMPGSWQKSPGGWRWVSGYWGVAAQEETEYLPPPPDTIERGPSTPSPGDNYSYVPGLWTHQVNRFVWRPGYWLGFRPGWVWVPACYRWTPCGFIYVPGFWDVPILERGLLFAPVRFTSAVYLRPGFVYRPAFCIQPDFLCGALFVRRGAPCYFFGDYFATGYRGRFTPWVNARVGRGVGVVDANFGYYRHAYRGHPGWERGLNGLYDGRFNGTIAAPPRTLVQQNTVINNIVVNKTTTNVVNKNVNITNIQNVSVLAPVKKINKVNVTALSSLSGATPAALTAAPVSRQLAVEKVSPARLQEEKAAVTRYTALSRERRATEAKLVDRAPKTETSAPVRAKIELPKGTPPARVVRSKDAPPPPERPKTEWNPETIKAVTPKAEKKDSKTPLIKKADLPKVERKEEKAPLPKVEKKETKPVPVVPKTTNPPKVDKKEEKAPLPKVEKKDGKPPVPKVEKKETKPLPMPKVEKQEEKAPLPKVEKKETKPVVPKTTNPPKVDKKEEKAPLPKVEKKETKPLPMPGVEKKETNPPMEKKVSKPPMPKVEVKPPPLPKATTPPPPPPKTEKKEKEKPEKKDGKGAV